MARLVQHITADEPAASLTLAELDQALRATDPTALLVAPRILRRVIKQDAGVSGLGLRVPHRKTYVIGREDLLTIVGTDDLDLDTDAELADQVILIARPTAEALDALSRDKALVKFWRQLFHARVHAALDQQIAEGRLGEPEIRARIRQIGETEFDEIRSVLRQEDYLLPPRIDATVYIEFAAVYLELRHFVPSFSALIFPPCKTITKSTNCSSRTSTPRNCSSPRALPMAWIPPGPPTRMPRNVRDMMSRRTCAPRPGACRPENGRTAPRRRS